MYKKLNIYVRPCCRLMSESDVTFSHSPLTRPVTSQGSQRYIRCVSELVTDQDQEGGGREEEGCWYSRAGQQTVIFLCRWEITLLTMTSSPPWDFNSSKVNTKIYWASRTSEQTQTLQHHVFLARYLLVFVLLSRLHYYFYFKYLSKLNE